MYLPHPDLAHVRHQELLAEAEEWRRAGRPPFAPRVRAALRAMRDHAG